VVGTRPRTVWKWLSGAGYGRKIKGAPTVRQTSPPILIDAICPSSCATLRRSRSPVRSLETAMAGMGLDCLSIHTGKGVSTSQHSGEGQNEAPAHSTAFIRWGIGSSGGIWRASRVCCAALLGSALVVGIASEICVKCAAIFSAISFSNSA
jgi:hypothetical protein